MRWENYNTIDFWNLDILEFWIGKSTRSNYINIFGGTMLFAECKVRQCRGCGMPFIFLGDRLRRDFGRRCVSAARFCGRNGRDCMMRSGSPGDTSGNSPPPRIFIFLTSIHEISVSYPQNNEVLEMNANRHLGGTGTVCRALPFPPASVALLPAAGDPQGAREPLVPGARPRGCAAENNNGHEHEEGRRTQR